MKIPFAIKSDNTRSGAANSQRLINMYAEPNPQDPLNPPKYPYTLYGTPGLKPWLTLGDGTGKVNGSHVMGNILFVVNGGNVYTIDESKTQTLIGTIGGASTRVMMEDNGTQVAILKEDGTMWVATTSSVVQVTDPNYQLSSSMTAADGFLIPAVIDSDEFFISTLDDYLTYDALDFSRAQEKSDFIVRPFAFNNTVWMMGETSMEPFSNTGDANFPYQQIPGGTNTARGCAAKFSLAQDDSTFLWLGDNRVVYALVNYSPNRVSTFGIENDIAEFSVVNDAFGFIFTINGHKNYILTFPTENRTFALDLTTLLWHELQSYGGGRWIPNCCSFFTGKNIVGDYNSGHLYELDLDTYTDNGQTIQRWIYTQNSFSDNKRFVVDSIQLDIDAGLALANGQGSDPQIMMQFSDDGGETWSNEKWVSMGKIGQYFKRAVWRRCGLTRQRVFRFLLSDPVKYQVNGLTGDLRLYKA